jgi:hypothetical protein
VEYVKTDINTNKTSEDNIKIYKEKYVDWIKKQDIKSNRRNRW